MSEDMTDPVKNEEFLRKRVEELRLEKEGLRQTLSHFSDTFFRQAFCASLSGYRANQVFAHKNSDGEYVVASPLNIVAKAIEDAQEAVRQLGALSKVEEVKCSSGHHTYKGWDAMNVGNGTCIYCGNKEQARDS